MEVKKIILDTTLVLAVFFFFAGCAMQKKTSSLHQNAMQTQLVLPEEHTIARKVDTSHVASDPRDTIVITDDETGKVIYFMNAVEDESGEMVANDVIQASYVTARFRNVAERLGKVDIEFQVVVPQAMQDSKWQIRLDPDLYVFEECSRLEPVIVTGKDYRKSQMRGYQQYDKWVAKIVMDTTRFVDLNQLELFLRRNIPQIFAFKTDSTFVTDEQFASAFGVTETEAIEHFTNKFAKRLNESRKDRKGKMFKRFVRAPIVKEGLRLDTVLQNIDGDFVYNYIQEINTRPKLRKVDVVLSGAVFEIGKKIYTIPATEPLTFYISSLSAFVDPREKYLTKVIERRAEANATYSIVFEQGKSTLDSRVAENASEMSRIKGNIISLIENETFDLDSIIVVAASSPEGSWEINEKLTTERSHTVASYFDKFIRERQDSLEKSVGFVMSVDDDMSEGTMKKAAYEKIEIPLTSKTEVENWPMLDYLVEVDTVLTAKEKHKYSDLRLVKDPDVRERRMQEFEHYSYMRDKLYPRLRVVRFNFHLHRKGMVKDTVHTTVLDTVYMNGVQAIRDFDYERAITLLRPYNDYNTAVAFSAMDYNASALAILEKLEKTAQVNYMLAVIYSRQGRNQKAVECYMKSCKQEPSYVHRGNLDPEISALIKKYGLNVMDDEEDFDYSL